MGWLHWYAADTLTLILLMFHKARPVDFPLCQELGMIVRFVKYQRSLQAEKLITFLFGHKDSRIQYY